MRWETKSWAVLQSWPGSQSKNFCLAINVGCLLIINLIKILLTSYDLINRNLRLHISVLVSGSGLRFCTITK